MNSQTMFQSPSPSFEQHLVQCCLCKMYLEMGHFDFLEFSKEFNEDLSNFICTECVLKSSLMQQIDILTQQVSQFQSQLRNHELTSLEKSFDKSVKEMTENLAKLNINVESNTSKESINSLPEQEFIVINDTLSSDNQDEDELTRILRLANSGSNPCLAENYTDFLTSNGVNGKQTSTPTLNKTEELHIMQQTKSEILETKVLLIGDRQLKHVNVGEYKKHDKTVLKVVHPNTKIIQTCKTAEYLVTKLHKNINTVIAHVGANDIKNRRSMKMFDDFQKFSEVMNEMGKTLVISGPLPTASCNSETFSRLYDLNLWLSEWCERKGILFIDNFQLFWKKFHLFDPTGYKLNDLGSLTLSNHIRSCTKHLL